MNCFFLDRFKAFKACWQRSFNSDQSQCTELKAKLKSNWGQSSFLSVILTWNCWLMQINRNTKHVHLLFIFDLVFLITIKDLLCMKCHDHVNLWIPLGGIQLVPITWKWRLMLKKLYMQAQISCYYIINDPRYLCENLRKYKNFGKLVYNVKS